MITPAECSSSYPPIQRGFYCRLSSVGPQDLQLSTLVLFTREQREGHKIMFKYSRQLHLKIGKKFPAHAVAFIGYKYFQGSASITVKYKKDLTQHFNTFTNERSMYFLSCWCFLFSFLSILPLPLWNSQIISWKLLFSEANVSINMSSQIFYFWAFQCHSSSQEHLDIATKLDMVFQALGIIFAPNDTSLY